MDLGLIGKRVLVTGSSHGIGLSIAQAFHLEGCQVVANGRDATKLAASVKDQVGYFGIPADMTDPQQARKLIDGATELLGGIDILVCNVGSGASVKPGTEQLEDWQRSLSTNFLSATNAVGAAIAELKKTKGVIVCISSICGDEVIQGAPVPYSAAKAALNAYIRGMSLPLGLDGIRINGVALGNILFKGSVWDEKVKENASAVDQMLADNVPLKRFGSLTHATNLTLWLSSPLSGFNTGSIHLCDGGQTRS